jgi:hypothetical protein
MSNRTFKSCSSCHCEERGGEAILLFIGLLQDWLVGSWLPLNDLWRVFKYLWIGFRVSASSQLLLPPPPVGKAAGSGCGLRKNDEVFQISQEGTLNNDDNKHISDDSDLSD